MMAMALSKKTIMFPEVEISTETRNFLKERRCSATIVTSLVITLMSAGHGSSK